MAQKHPWSYMMAIPLALGMACTGGNDGSSGDTVRVSLQGRYEKRTLTSSGFSSQLTTLPTRYCWAEVWHPGDTRPLSWGNLGTDGTGSVDVPRGVTFSVKVWADITVPGAPGSIFYMHGSVKSGAIQDSYANADAFNQTPTWYMESRPQVADSSFTLPLLACANPSNADGNAGPFAIVDQMATFAERTRELEPNLLMPDLHAFWNSGNSDTTYPKAALNGATPPQRLEQPLNTDASDPVPGNGRPIYQHKIRYAEPFAADSGADAYNDSLLQETFARLFFSSGIIRSDNDADAYISPDIASESTIAFAKGFGDFISCAYRKDPFLYDFSRNGQITYWRVDQHQRPTYGGEFLGSSIARSLWGIWKNSSTFSGTQNGLFTIWDATNPKVADQAFEFGNAPLGCYPTYLVGLTRRTTAQLGNVAGNAIRAELALENIGNGRDVTIPGGTYYTINTTNPLDSLWITENTLPITRSGSLRTLDPSTYGYVYYDQDQAQTYRIYHDGNNRTITLTTSSPGLLVELFDSKGYLSLAQAPGSANSISLAGRSAGYYAVRVRLDPFQIFSNGNASYTLTVQ